MEKAKKIVSKLYVALIGATAWGMIQNSTWITRYKEILIRIQTGYPDEPAYLLWRVIATIIALTVVSRGITSLQKKFSMKAFIGTILSIVWLGFVTMVILTATIIMLGGNPTSMEQLIMAIAKAIH